MSPNPQPCTNANGCASCGGLSRYLMVEMTNTKNGRAKMHAKLLCWMDRQPIELKGYAKHTEP